MKRRATSSDPASMLWVAVLALRGAANRSFFDNTGVQAKTMLASLHGLNGSSIMASTWQLQHASSGPSDGKQRPQGNAHRGSKIVVDALWSMPARCNTRP